MIQSSPRNSRFTFLSLLLLLLLSCFCCYGTARTTPRTLAVVGKRRQERHNALSQARRDLEAVVGGYSTLSNLSDSNALEVATYVFNHLNDLDLESSTSGVSFENDTVSVKNIDIEIVRGYSQVVAGLNYRLLLVFLSSSSDSNSTTSSTNETCLGAVAVEVYARWDGTKNITTWGNSVNCTRAMELMHNPDEEYGAFNDDFGDRSSGESSHQSSNGFESSNGANTNHPMTGGAQGMSGADRWGINNARLHYYCLGTTTMILLSWFALV